MVPARPADRSGTDAAGNPIDPRQLRNALGRYPTGVAVITAEGPDGRRAGLAANSFAAVSLDPPLILWSLRRDAASLAAFSAAGHFAVNVLTSGQSALSHHFAQTRPDKFDGIGWRPGLGGAPLIDGALARFECAVERQVDGGDHVIFIGRVMRFSYGDGEPLVFSAGQYCRAVPMRVAHGTPNLDDIWGGLGW